MALTPNGTGVLVKAPRCTQPPRYGLLSAVEPLKNVDPHWQASGIEFEDFLCTPGVTGFVDNCPPATGFTKPAERNTLFCHSDPFIVVGSYDCSTGGRPVDEAFEISRQRLLSWEGRLVEEILWTGNGANGMINPSFAFGNDTCGIDPVNLSPDGSFDAISAIAVLENALGDSLPCEGVIHVPYAYAAYLHTHNLLERRGDEYYTPTGYRVILGHGYPGSGPGNVAADPGTTWLVGTGPLLIARGDIMTVPEQIKEGVNRMVNDITVRNERFYSVGFACSLFWVNARLTCACCA